MTVPRFSAEASLYKTSGRYQIGRNAINLPAQMMSAIYMNIPGFTAESALSTTGRGYRDIVTAVTDDSRRSVFMALINQECVFDYTLTVVENGVPSTVDVYTCTITVGDGDGGGGPGGPFGENGGGGSGGSGGGIPFPFDKKPPLLPGPEFPIDRCSAKQVQSKEGKRCTDKIDQDLMNNVPVKDRHYMQCTGSTLQCCKGDPQDKDPVIICDDPVVSPR